MDIFLIGICGTGMGSLAGLLAEAGHQVRGSDPFCRPPMSTLLARRGIQVMPGWNPANLEGSAPDLVIVGNVCRPDNPEALRAAELGLPRLSMPAAIRQLFLDHRQAVVVAGTHGKTTTTALLAHLLVKAGADPTVLVGGSVPDLGGSARLGEGRYFVLEGDEYDSAYFEKQPKFWSYAPWAAVLTSIQHDHLDIYPTPESYVRAFKGFVERLPADGLLLVWAGDPQALAVAQKATCRVVAYALDSDSAQPHAFSLARGRLFEQGGGAHRSRLRISWLDGSQTLVSLPLLGRHNARNALAAALLAHEACGVDPDDVARAAASFRGVALRQELVGTRRGIRVYRDFAHHPEAVAETLLALRPVAQTGRLIVAYEPRSATACRNLHQQAYEQAFDHADDVILAPLGRPEIPPAERLDLNRLARGLRRRGVPATAASSLEQLLRALLGRARPGDVVALLSNGHFGHLDRKFLQELEKRRGTPL